MAGCRSGALAPACSWAGCTPANLLCPNGYAALTYDDGPDENTALLLDTLKAKHAKATFFLIGSQIAARPGDVAREVREGHVVGNHTWSHPDLLATLTDDQIRQELSSTTAAITAAGAPKPTLWRPPHGVLGTSDHVEALGTELGLSQTLWTIDTSDWTGISVQDTIDRSLHDMGPGMIVLMHSRMTNSVLATPAILDGMHQRGICPGVVRRASTRNTLLAGAIEVAPA